MPLSAFVEDIPKELDALILSLVELDPIARPSNAAEVMERLAAIASEIVATFLVHGFPEGADVINVNLPESADIDTPRRVVDVARVGYDRLFGAKREGVYAHEFGGGFVHFGGLEGTDVEAARNGEVAITPIRLQHTGSLPDALRADLER